MGSGKGQSRRVQSAVSSSAFPSVRCDSSQWAKFVRSIDLREMSLRDYYGIVLPPGFLMGGALDRVLQELFRDAVAVGAIALPSFYHAEDFEFAVSAVDPNRVGECWQAKISLKDKDMSSYEETVLLPIPTAYAAISDSCVDRSLEKLAEGIKVFVDGVEETNAPPY